jgi:hypothetical protein
VGDFGIVAGPFARENPAVRDGEGAGRALSAPLAVLPLLRTEKLHFWNHLVMDVATAQTLLPASMAAAAWPFDGVRKASRLGEP